jgi:signal transduction histidine kinase
LRPGPEPKGCVSMLTDPLLLGAIDDRMIAVMRLMLALLALLSTYIDPAETTSYVLATYTVLAFYLAYSIVLLMLAGRRRSTISATVAYWAELGWDIVLIGCSKGSNSIFFAFLFFAILVASFQEGFAAGLRVTLAATILFPGVGFMTAPDEPEFQLNGLLLRPMLLLVLGYMIACWGGAELMFRRRLALLKDVSVLANPRFGVDRTFGALMERLRAFYEADMCMLVMAERPPDGYTLRRVSRQHPGTDGGAEAITEEVARLLLALPVTQAQVSGSLSWLWGWVSAVRREQAYDVVTRERLPEPWQGLGELLAAQAYITVPVRYRGETVGRLYLTAAQRYPFAMSDVDFLLQVLEHTMPTIDNIRLVDRLASDAAEEERRRIGRDLHDSVIQPYIGLQMGLVAIQKKLTTQSQTVPEDLERLLALTNAGIADLRQYMGGLRENGARDSGLLPGGLLPAVQRFAKKFAEATGIAVHVEAETALPVHDRLAAEVFQMVAEGLSNVRRHTRSAQATVTLACHEHHLSLSITNDMVAGTVPLPFTPRSITERATALGGGAHVEWPEHGGTVVVVDIPL